MYIVERIRMTVPLVTNQGGGSLATRYGREKRAGGKDGGGS